MKLEAYVTVNFDGSIRDGEVAIAIVVRKSGEPDTARIMIYGYMHLSYYKAQAIAAVKMMQLMKKPVDLDVTVSDWYMYNIMTGQAKPKKHKEEWAEYDRMASNMISVRVNMDENHIYKYSSLVKTQKGGYHMCNLKKENAI